MGDIHEFANPRWCRLAKVLRTEAPATSKPWWLMDGTDWTNYAARVDSALPVPPPAAPGLDVARAAFDRIIAYVTPGVPGFLIASEHIGIWAREGRAALGAPGGEK
jgi:hypothetical protein